MAVKAIRNWWNNFKQDKSDTSVSNVEEDEDLSRKRQLSMDLSQTLRTRQLLVDFNGRRPVLSLRAPLDLVNFSSVSRPRWPIECEVISKAIHHIEWEPLEPEPFYSPTGHERTPMPTGEERGKVVYCIDQATKCPYFTSSRVGGSRGPIKSTTSYDDNQTDLTLDFESRFESGNLQKAVRVGVYEYELTLRTDMYTQKHTQWFYFRIRNMAADVTYRFTIVNLMKNSSLYSQGMRPLLYSERAAKGEGVGWQRIGSNIKYYRNNAQENDDTNALYSLTWTFQFPHESDTCYLAHCYPYTYTHLQRYLSCVSSNPSAISYCKVRVLCHSLAGNAVYVVTVTSPGGGKIQGRAKKAVVVTARVHPGETNSSWMMEGFLDFLLGDSDDAQLLRDTFVFKVVPMLNPDGVVVGNYRCSLAGRDLNRNYKTVLRNSFPCVWHTRKMVERLMAETDVVVYCDFHGHNRKNNVFMYGCNNRVDASLKLHERVFPLMMSKNATNKFSFKSCKFRMQKNKEGTGRITMWRLGVRNSYTMEATFGGSTLGDRKGTHFTIQDLKSLGVCFCDTLLDYCDPDPSKISYCLSELSALLRKEASERTGKDLDSNFTISDLETSTSGSNSSDSDGPPAHLVDQSETPNQEQTSMKKKKKRLKSRKERNQQRPESVKNDNAEVLQSSIERESNFPNENGVKDTIQERAVRRRGKKWQVNSSLKKAGISPAKANPEENIQVNLWQDCDPVKDNFLEDLRAVKLHRPHVNTASSHPGDRCRVGVISVRKKKMRKKREKKKKRKKKKKREREREKDTVFSGDISDQEADARELQEQRKYSSRLLHLRSLHPLPLSFLHSTRQLHRQPAQSFVSCKVFRGISPSLAESGRSPLMMFDVTAKLQPSLTTDKSNKYSNSSSLQYLDDYFASEGLCTSQGDMTKAKLKDEECEGGSSEVSLLPMRPGNPIGEEQNDLCLKDTKPQNFFVPILSDTDLLRKRLCKEILGDKRQKGVLPPVSKSMGFRKLAIPRPQNSIPVGLQAEDIRHQSLGRGNQISLAIKTPEIMLPSQSGFLFSTKLTENSD